MKINHNQLKSIYQTQIQEKKLDSNQHCPPVEDLIGLIRSELSKSKRDKLLNHLQECPSCSQEAQAIIHIIKEEKKFVNRITELPGNQKNNRQTKKNKIFNFPFELSWKFISAATFALVLVLGVSISLYMVFNEHKYRGEDRININIIKPKKKIIIYENNIQFKWDEVPGTQFYKAVLYNHSLYPIWESGRLSDNQAELPSKVYENMKHKAAYFLFITSYQKNGKIIESPFKEFKAFIKHPKNQ